MHIKYAQASGFSLPQIPEKLTHSSPLKNSNYEDYPFLVGASFERQTVSFDGSFVSDSPSLCPLLAHHLIPQKNKWVNKNTIANFENMKIVNWYYQTSSDSSISKCRIALTSHQNVST